MHFLNAKKWVFALMLFILGLALGVHLFSQQHSSQQLKGLADYEVVEWRLGNTPLKVEVVQSPSALTLGLGGRQEITADGMLFVLPAMSQPAFWMKGMHFPIDIIWIQRGKVVGIERNVQPADSNTQDAELDRLSPSVPVDMVLETKPGRIEWPD